MVFRDKGRDEAPDVYNIIHPVEQFIVPLFNTIGSPALTQRYGGMDGSTFFIVHFCAGPHKPIILS